MKDFFLEFYFVIGRREYKCSDAKNWYKHDLDAN